MNASLRKPVHLPSGLELSSADQVSLGSGAPDYVAFLAKFGAKQLGEVNTRNTKVGGGYHTRWISRLLAAGEARAGSLGDTPRHHSTAEAHLRDDQVRAMLRFLNEPSRRFHNHGEEPTRLKALTSAFTFKTLLKHYAKWAPKQRS